MEKRCCTKCLGQLFCDNKDCYKYWSWINPTKTREYYQKINEERRLAKLEEKRLWEESVKREKERQKKYVPKRKNVRFKDKYPELYNAVDLKKLKDFLISVYGNVCMKCGSTEVIVLEHIKSRRFGGTNEVSNLQLLCNKCNFEKGHKQLDYRPFLIET